MTKTDIQMQIESVVELSLVKKPIITKREKGTCPKRLFLFRRDGNLCFYSGKPMTQITSTIEHLIPLSKGGTNCKENLVLCLQEHNSRVGNASLREKLEYKYNLTKEITSETKEILSLKIQLKNSCDYADRLKLEIGHQKKKLNEKRQIITNLSKEMKFNSKELRKQTIIVALGNVFSKLSFLEKNVGELKEDINEIIQWAKEVGDE